MAIMITIMTSAENITRRPRKVDTFGPLGSFLSMMNNARNKLKTMYIRANPRRILSAVDNNVVLSNKVNR